MIQEKLIAEICDDEIQYAVFQADEKLNCKILTKIISKNPGINKEKIFDMSLASKRINEDIKNIEKKVDKVFRNVTIVLNQKDFLCTNLTGFKKLNGSKVEKRDLDYILNEGKISIINDQEKNSIIHILNSYFILDKIKQDKVPLNIFGDHLSLHMTFISLSKNNLKNLNYLFSGSDLKVERVINKSFAFGIDLINKKRNLKNFTLINMGKELSTISIYENSSLVFLKTFNFGTNMIYRDITQLCSLQKDEVDMIMQEIDVTNLSQDIKYLDKKYFFKSDFTKISKVHLKDIINTRIDEMLNYLFGETKNFENLNSKNSNINIFFDDETVYKNLSKLFKKISISKINRPEMNFSYNSSFSSLEGAAELIFKGWHSEAIPLNIKKKSMISAFFSHFFKQ